MIDYTLIRSKRRTAALSVRDGAVVVRAPLRMPRSEIDQFVAAHEKWISERLDRTLEQARQREAFSLSYGDKIEYRGETYPITAQAGTRAGFKDGTFYMPPDLPAEQIQRICQQIYRLLAKHDLTEKTLRFAKQMGVMPSAVKINAARTRWGSCSGRKSINFSWRLIMADDAVIDYVVVHELAHLTEMNHSERFWAIVERNLPDYRARQARLKILQKRLATENWT